MRTATIVAGLLAALALGCAFDPGAGGDEGREVGTDPGADVPPGPDAWDPGPDAAPCGGLVTCTEMQNRYRSDCWSVYPGGDCCRFDGTSWVADFMNVDCADVPDVPEPSADVAEPAPDVPDPGPDAPPDVPADAPPDAPDPGDVPPLPARLDLDPATLSFFSLPIGSIRYAVAGLDRDARTCATLVWGLYDGSTGGAATCDGSWPGLPYVVLERGTDGPCTAWDYGSTLSTVSMDGCADWGQASPAGVDLADFEVAVERPDDAPLVVSARARAAVDPVPVSLGFRYATDVPENLFIQSGDDYGQPSWAQVLGPDGQPRMIFDRCDVPSCDTPDAGVCGIAFRSVRNVTNGSYSGQAWLTWDGRFREMDAGGQCRKAVPAPAGDYTLRVCFGWQTGDAPGGNGPEVKDPTCREVPFTLPGAAKVWVQADFGG